MLFNASERKGILVLLFLLTGTIIIPHQFLPKDHHLFLLPVCPVVNVDSFYTTIDTNLPIKSLKRHTQKVDPIELNIADSATLVKIRGIGPYYASKIIHYRQRLGGYVSLQQLKELKMTYFNVDSCHSLLTVNPTLITKRNLDTMSFKEILRHPYLEYEDVQMIFDAKRKFGRLSYALLEEKKILAAYKLKKIKPYFQ